MVTHIFIHAIMEALRDKMNVSVKKCELFIILKFTPGYTHDANKRCGSRARIKLSAPNKTQQTQLSIRVTSEHVTYMSVAKAAHVTVRLSQDMGRQL